MGTRRNPAATAATALLLLALTSCGQPISSVRAPLPALAPPPAVATYSKPSPSQPQVQGKDIKVTGTVVELLPPDNDDRPHELFIIQVAGKRIKVAHNTALAPFVPVKVGQPIEAFGEYLEVKPLPVLHWTHHDPGHHRPDGYILYNGHKYQ
jgi:hypothetical protein